MLKIAYIGQKGILNPSGGGVETHVEELSVRMAKKGFDVFLYTRPHYTPKEYKKYEGVNLISLPSIYTKHLDAGSHTFLAILHAIKNKVDIIHIHGIGPAWLCFIPRIIAPKIKVIVTAHSEDWEHKKWGVFAQFMLKFGALMSAVFAHEVITVSKKLQKRYLTLYKRSITLIPNGVTTRQNSDIDDRLIKQFNLTREKYILTVSRLVRHKGIHYLVEAFKKVKLNPEFADFKLVIVGQTSFTDDYYEFLKSLVNGRNDIIFTGGQRGEMLEQLYTHSYMYVSPSQSEGLSISLLEAMAYAKPVLVSDISANADLVAGDASLGGVGFIFRNTDINDLTYKMVLLLTHAQVARKVGKKARSYVKTYYNWEDVVDRITKIYKSLVLIKDKTKKIKSVSSEKVAWA